MGRGIRRVAPPCPLCGGEVVVFIGPRTNPRRAILEGFLDHLDSRHRREDFRYRFKLAADATEAFIDPGARRDGPRITASQ